MSDKIPAKNLEAEPSATRTIELYASRQKIYVKEIKGFFQRLRNVTLYGFMGMYFAVCWINLDGKQLVHFDLPARQFHLFGTTFWPQDFILLTWMLIICAFGLFFVTTLFGRVWCGYTCPQTVWTLIFMWIEEKTEGSRNQRIKLDKAELTSEKILRKGSKHFLWLVVALATGITFVGYFYPIRELVVDLFTLSIEETAAYFWIAFFTAATYINAGWLREQVCLYMCPYARFQSVMFDSDTMVVSYDPGRGEPRGSRKKGADPKQAQLGDCIDCNMCVQVCPTGIDIRNGLQYECIGCALCIDACDQIMDKMNYPRGLIRYTNENSLKGQKSHLLRPTSIGYGLVLALMIGSVVYSLSTRVPLVVDVLKDRGALYRYTGQGMIENAYTLKILNMSDTSQYFNVAVTGVEAIKITTPTRVLVASGEVYSLPAAVEVDPKHVKESAQTIIFEVRSETDPDLNQNAQSRFLAPLNP